MGIAIEMTKNLPAVSEARKNGDTRFRRVGRLDRISNWEHLAEAACFSASALADRCGVSRRHLERHIRSLCSKSLGAWLLDLRLRQSCRLLSQGWSVKETAYSTGFRQVSHFSRCFKRRFGIVPSAVMMRRDFTGASPAAGSQQLILPEMAQVIERVFPRSHPAAPSHHARSVA